MGAKLQDQFTNEEICDKTIERIRLKSDQALSKKEEPTFRKWMMYRLKKVGYCFDWKMVFHCYLIWKHLHKNMDYFIVIVGPEGSGKSTLSFQMGAWILPDQFVIKNICYTAEQYLQQMSEKAKKYADKLDELEEGQEVKIPPTLLDLDEGGNALLSKQSMSKNSISLTQTFFAQRVLSTAVIIQIPNFFFLDNILRKHRTRLLIDITKQGKYKAYKPKAIEVITKQGQESKQISGIKIPESSYWCGNYSKTFPKTIDKNEYLKHKIRNVSRVLLETQQMTTDNRMFGLSQTAKEIGIAKNTLIKMAKDGKINARMIGQKWFLDKDSYHKLTGVENETE